MSKTLTLTGLRELLLDGCDLALDHGQLLLEGLLGLSIPCDDSRSEHQDKELTKSTWSQPGATIKDLPSTTA
jgi:hypothetical protein